MSSEAAQKAYPADEWSAGQGWRVREAFDRGAVEALRQAAAEVDEQGFDTGEQLLARDGLRFLTVADWLRQVADDWEAGR